MTAIAFAIAGFGLSGCRKSGPSSGPVPRPGDALTFNHDVAPILFQHCAPCHRPGQSAPFNLLTYADAWKHASDIARLTRTRYMPPWLPEPGFGEFVGERRLDARQIEILGRWVEGGAAEGAAADLPPTPVWPEGWQLGEPDLVLEMTPPYTLEPEGPDVYRNFVIPVPIGETRYVRAIEFHPRNRSVHHVRILIDQSGQARQLDEQDPEPGFGGMRTAAIFPPGHMLTWVPGKTPSPEPDGLPWVLERDTDLVLQIHMRRSGRREELQPAIGLYFTNRPPAKAALVIGLLSQLIDIPAGEKNHIEERSFTLPVDVQVIAVLPHLHYLGKEVQGFATLPDGTKKWLIRIPHWDFDWQGEYRYAKPVFLPKDAVITMRYGYDNSSDNLRNPHHPPRRVIFGPQSSDEMGELWLQVLPNDAKDLAILRREKQLMDSRETAAFYQNFLRAHPDDAPSHVGLGKVLGPLGQTEAAERHFQTALELNAHQREAHYYLGLIRLDRKRYAEARAEFEAELRVDPKCYKARVALGAISIEEQDLEQAEAHVRAAAAINPRDPAVQQMLSRIVKARNETKP